MTPDANTIGQEERRRGQFARWLVKAWIWAGDNGREQLATVIEEIIRHAEEPDYPLWEMAKKAGLTGDSKIANILRKKHGIPVMGAKMIGWEREINFSPIIALDPTIWDTIYSAMGWPNRTADLSYQGDNFYLWSPTGNIVRFIKRSNVVSNDHVQDA